MPISIPAIRQLDEIVERIKFISGKGKRVTDADLYEIAGSVTGTGNGDKIIDLIDIAIMTGNHAIPTASIRAQVNGIECVNAAVGSRAGGCGA